MGAYKGEGTLMFRGWRAKRDAWICGQTLQRSTSLSGSDKLPDTTHSGAKRQKNFGRTCTALWDVLSIFRSREIIDNHSGRGDIGKAPRFSVVIVEEAA